jgi:hypothetical protein
MDSIEGAMPRVAALSRTETEMKKTGPNSIPLAYCSLAMIVVTFAAASAETQVLKIRIPDEILTEHLVILSGVYGKGLSLGQMNGKAGVHEYEVSFREDEHIKLMAYCPGYMIVCESSPAPNKPWTPAFKPAPTTVLAGTLRDSGGKPVANKTIAFRYPLIEAMAFFGYRDGAVPQFLVASTQTGKDGAFATQVPVFDEDPVLKAEKRYGTFHRTLDLLLDGQRTRGDGDWVLLPSSVECQKEYARPVEIVVIQKGRLKGSIAQHSLDANGIAGAVKSGDWPETETGTRLSLQAESGDGKTSYNCMLKEDLTFSVALSPGDYRLKLSEMKRGYVLHKQVELMKFTVKENEDLELLIGR